MLDMILRQLNEVSPLSYLTPAYGGGFSWMLMAISALQPDPEVSEQEDGGYLIDFNPVKGFDKEKAADHTANLAEFLDPEVLGTIAIDLIEMYDADWRSSTEWRETIKKGIGFLGLKIEEMTKPFVGAAGAHFPLMIEAAMQFQARAINELFPSSGPCRSVIMGTQTQAKVSQAQRVKDFMNFQLQFKMTGYRESLDKLLFYLPITGSCFKKIYWDKVTNLPVSKFIPVEDFVVSYYAEDLASAQRYTHVLHLDGNQLRKKQVAGLYRDIELGSGYDEERGPVQDKIDQIEGRERPTEVDRDNRYTILEMHIDYDIEGFEDKDEKGKATGIALPYVVSIDKDSRTILSVRRNWEEDDPTKTKRMWFCHYQYIPGFGFYGHGLIHILGNLQKSATAILRAMIDASMYSIMPGGFKTRGLKIQNGQLAVAWGEWREVDGYGDDIRKSLMPLPSKENSQATFALLEMLIESGRRVASIADVNVGDMNVNEATGAAVMAQMEQAVKVMSAIHMRLHETQKEEYRQIFRLNGEHTPDSYPYEVENATRTIKRKDFNDSVSIQPVSDPNNFSEAQRILRSQAQLQLAQAFPQQHNIREALFRMHTNLGAEKINDLLPPEQGPLPMDPTTEIFAILHNRPVMAWPHQNHKAHIDVLTASMQDPKLFADPNNQQLFGPQVAGLLADHTAHLYRLQVSALMGKPLPPPPVFDPSNPGAPNGWTPLSPDEENQIANMEVTAAQQLSQMHQQNQQLQQNAATASDPMVQIEMGKLKVQQMDAQTKQLDVQLKHQGDGAKVGQEQQMAQIKMGLEQQKAQIEREKAALSLRVKQMEADIKGREGQQRLDIERHKFALEQARKDQESMRQHHEWQLEQERNAHEATKESARKDKESSAKETATRGKTQHNTSTDQVIVALHPLPAPKSKRTLKVHRDDKGKVTHADIVEEGDE